MKAKGGFLGGNLALAVRALRVYWPVFLALQACAVLFALGYYWWSPAHAAADAILRWRQSGGIAFVVGASVFSGAILPEACKALLRPPGYRPLTLGGWAHIVSLMAVIGLTVDVFYRQQGRWFVGIEPPLSVAIKIAVDQFAFALFVILPFVVIWFAWKEEGYSVRRTLAVLRPRLFLERIPPIFLPNLMFWVPALIALYTLPTELQFVMWLFINAAWCLVMIFVARAESGDA